VSAGLPDFLRGRPRWQHHPDRVTRGMTTAGRLRNVNEKATADTRRRSPARAASNGNHAVHDQQHDRQPAGMDLPLLGHVPYKSLGFMAGLGVAGAIGVIEWPVAAAAGIGYMLARR
jgi:hypothetical protein